MAHLVEVTVVCDRCQEEGERIEATETLVLGFDGPPFREVDLCAEHFKPYTDLRDLVEAKGRVIKTPAKKTGYTRKHDAARLQNGDYQCDSCERTFSTPQGLAAHRRTNHREVEKIECPVCGRICMGSNGYATHARMHEPGES